MMILRDRVPFIEEAVNGGDDGGRGGGNGGETF